MPIALLEAKRQKTADCEDLAKNPTPTVRKVAKVVGKLWGEDDCVCIVPTEFKLGTHVNK